MKCKGCGATYDPQLEYCPYCGLENTRRKRQLEALQRKKERYEAKRQQVLSQSAGEIRLRKVNRLMWIMAALMGIGFLISLGLFLVQDYVDSHQRADEVYLEQLKADGHWEAMQWYLYDVDSEEHLYGEYWQIALFAENVEDLRGYRDEYLKLDLEKYRAAFLKDASLDDYEREFCESHFDFLVRRILQDCLDILSVREEYVGDSWKAERYGVMTPEADALLSEFEAEARATLQLLFELSKEEIGQLKELGYLDTEAGAPYVKRAKEGLLHE